MTDLPDNMIFWSEIAEDNSVLKITGQVDATTPVMQKIRIIGKVIMFLLK